MGIPHQNAAQLHKKKWDIPMLCHFYVVKSWNNMAGFPTLDLKNVKTPLTMCKHSLGIRKIIQTSYLIMMFPSEWKLGVI
jgi:hypothetical protein